MFACLFYTYIRYFCSLRGTRSNEIPIMMCISSAQILVSKFYSSPPPAKKKLAFLKEMADYKAVPPQKKKNHTSWNILLHH